MGVPSLFKIAAANCEDRKSNGVKDGMEERRESIGEGTALIIPLENSAGGWTIGGLIEGKGHFSCWFIILPGRSNFRRNFCCNFSSNFHPLCFPLFRPRRSISSPPWKVLRFHAYNTEGGNCGYEDSGG